MSVIIVPIRSRSIQRVDISNPGAGYTIAPGIRFIGGSGVGAAATSKIGDGVVGVVTVQSGGSGYTTSPTITFNDEVFLSGVTTVSAAKIRGPECLWKHLCYQFD